MISIFRRKHKEKPKEEAKEDSGDVGIQLLESMLLRLYNMIYDLPIRWWEMLIVIVVGVFTGLGFGIMLSSYVKVRLP